MRVRRNLTAALCCTALLAGCGSPGGAHDEPAPPALPPVGKPGNVKDHKDFNGDGFDDYVTVLSPHSKDRKRTLPTLVVTYGSRKGLRPETAERVTAGPGGNGFTRVLRGDLDGDSFTDLISAREPNSKEPGAFEPFAMYGGKRGLGKPVSLVLEGNFTPLAVGDFNGDGSADLLDGGRGGSGDPNALPGLERGRLLLGPIDRSGKPSRQIKLDLGQHGYSSPQSAAVGDFDADGRTDVIFTYHFDAEEDESAPENLRSAAYYRGSTEGLVDGGPTTPDLGEALGTQDGPRAAAVDDVNGDGIDDVLASGSGAALNTGKITVLYGARSGLGKAKPALELTDNGTYWGVGPQAGDVNGDKVPDLVTHRPGFSLNDTDRILLLPGGPQGPQQDQAQVLSGDDPSIRNKIPRAADFGVLDLLDVNGDGLQDLITYSEFAYERRGAFLVLPGSRSGIDTSLAQRFTPEDLGVQLKLK
ncbi:FG-GAP repeat domain-containing protein [Streptomyces sp. NPDC055134]